MSVQGYPRRWIFPILLIALALAAAAGGRLFIRTASTDEALPLTCRAGDPIRFLWSSRAVQCGDMGVYATSQAARLSITQTGENNYLISDQNGTRLSYGTKAK